MMIESLSRSLNIPNEIPGFSKTIYPNIENKAQSCSNSDNKLEGELAMSLLFGLKMQEYGIMLSDSRMINREVGFISEHCKKIYIIANMIFGFTGKYNFEEGMIWDIIRKVISKPENHYKIMAKLQLEVVPQIQSQIQNRILNIHWMQAEDGKIVYMDLDIDKYNIYYHECCSGELRSSGINVVFDQLNIDNDKNQMIHMLKGKIVSESQIHNEINNIIQGYIIYKSGEIMKI